MRKRVLSFVLSAFIVFQGVLLCSCRKDDAGKFMTFGTYDGKPIEWIILSSDSDTYLLISKYILDARPYDTSHQELKWENSELRKWLNEDFYDQAFNDEEKAYIERHKDVIKNVMRKGSSLKPCAIAQGLAEITIRYSAGTKEWDTAACQIVVTEAGGLFVEPDGKEIRYNREDVYNRNGYIVTNRKENLYR